MSLWSRPVVDGWRTRRFAKTQAGQVNADQAPLVVTIREDGALFLQDTEIEPDKLIPRLSAIGEANKEVRIFVRGDKKVAYGEVLVLMGEFNQPDLNALRWLLSYRRMMLNAVEQIFSKASCAVDCFICVW